MISDLVFRLRRRLFPVNEHDRFGMHMSKVQARSSEDQLPSLLKTYLGGAVKITKQELSGLCDTFVDEYRTSGPKEKSDHGIDALLDRLTSEDLKLYRSVQKRIFIDRLTNLLVILGRFENAQRLRRMRLAIMSKYGIPRESVNAMSELGLKAKIAPDTTPQTLLVNLAYNKFLQTGDLRAFYHEASGSISHSPKVEDFVKDKTIAILGPMTEDLPAEVTKDETVVFIKVPPPDVLNKLKTVKKLVFFNTKYTINGTLDDFQVKNGDALTLVIGKWPSSMPGSIGQQLFLLKNELLPTGGPMMLQNVLFHLLLYGPEKIRMYGFNFYASANFYGKQYVTGDWHTKKMSLRESFARHDLMANFLFVKQLFDRGVIESDELGSGVLQLDVQGYAGLIESLH